MEFNIKVIDPSETGQKTLLTGKSECLILGLFEEDTFVGLAKSIDQASSGLLSRLMKSGEMTGKKNTHVLLHEIANTNVARILIIGLGKQTEFNERVWANSIRYTLRQLLSTKIKSATWVLPVAQDRDFIWTLRLATQLSREYRYNFIERHPYLKSKSKPQTATTVLQKIVFVSDKQHQKQAQAAIAQGLAIADGMDLARDLANLPANICTPSYLAKTARELASQHALKIEVLEHKQITALKMGAFLAVTQGSTQAPKFIVLKYQGANAKEAPIVLIGKGITFDSGGISLKPGEAMDEMKFDMCGAASVLGTMLAIAQMKLKKNVIVIVPTCENMPAGNAVKPGDVVVSMSGKTIEILNTDAEGRLILCDALTYAERFHPDAVIDVATLTGACVIALGHINSGLYASDDVLAEQLMTAGKQALDPAWRMPLDEAYQEQLKSNFADIANIGGRPAGSVTAACFLSRFTKKYRWAHLDIAGTAWKGGASKGATARPVPLLVNFLMHS